MDEKLQKLFQSRRFWAAAGGVLLVLLLPFEVKLLATILIAAWIIGDSIRSTKTVLLAVALTLCGSIATAGDLHDTCREATVRIRNGNSMGSGTLFRESEDHFYILTNAHVAGTGLGNRVQVEFWKEGHQSKPINAETVAVAYIPRAYRDIAVVRVDRRALGGYRPPIIPLAESQDSFNYQNIFSVGCPSGRWPTAFEGFALRRQTNGGDTIHFVPMPAGGRSGSAIFDVNGGEAQIIGLIAWRSTDSGGHGLDGRGETHGYGIAMTHQEVWAGLSGKQTTSSVLLVPPPNAVPLSTEVEPDAKVETKPEVPDGEENQGESDEVILKYSDPFAIERDYESIRSQRLPSGIPATGSDRDIMLLYQDPVSEGPQASPPALAYSNSCCPNCGCNLTTAGNCPNGQCPLPDRRQRQPQQYGQDQGGGLFPSLPRNREQGELENHLLRRPGERLRNLWPFPSVKDIVTWSIIGFFVFYFIGQFFKARFKRFIGDLATNLANTDVDEEPEPPAPKPRAKPAATRTRKRTAPK
ncbi:MAG: serine protease [Planctomycetota bacterium]